MFKQYRFRQYDFKLVIMIVLLTAIGILAVGSAKEALQTKQMMGALAGLFLMIVISLFDYTVLLKLYWVMYIVNIVLLALVRYSPLGNDAGGAQRWLNLFGFKFQPSETAKILLILFFAQFIMKNKKKINSLQYIGVSLILIGIPLFLIYKQPDLSTSIVIMLLFCVILFIGGLSYRIIFSVLAVAIPVAVIFLALILQPDQTILEGYQKDRILAFINPEAYANEEAYQQLNSIAAIGSGQFDGKGYKNNEISSVKNGNFISEPQTDFIFAIIGEEFGFKGGCVVIILLFLIVLECIIIARKAKDLAGAIIAGGMGTLIGFQGFLNIGVATFIIPNTGLPLPFVSYGLTSLLSLYIGMGFVLNVSLQNKK